MKIMVSCIECFQMEIDEITKGKGDLSNYDYKSNLYIVPINDNGIYNLTCKNGHTIYISHNCKKYELLFESGYLAYTDGYYREAVASIASSLERFFEYCTLLFTINNEVDNEEFKKGWKLVKNQSERQLGAFYFLYLNFFKKTIQPMSNQDVEFRNKVIHKGYFPSREETLNYIQNVFNKINEIAKEIFLNINQEVFDKVELLLEEEMKKQKLKPGNLCMSVPMLLSDIFCDNSKSFDDKIDRFNEMASIAYGK